MSELEDGQVPMTVGAGTGLGPDQMYYAHCNDFDSENDGEISNDGNPNRVYQC